jgi:hypothetical protein
MKDSNQKLTKLSSILFVIFMLLASSVSADIVLEKARFHKCYALFVRQAMPIDHPLWINVSDGTRTGTDACMELLNKAGLDNNGNLLTPSDDEGKRIIRTFSDWHMTFFNFNNVGQFLSSNTIDVIDRLGGVHYFTRALFHPTSEFREVVTLNYALLGKRNGSVERKYSVQPLKQSYPSGLYATDFMMHFWQGQTITSPLTPPNLNPTLVETGELIGIIKDESPIILSQGVDFDFAGYGAGKNIKQHFGAGFLGSQGFLLAHIPELHTHTSKYLQDGAIVVHRTLGKSILEDVLCRTGPYLRSSDVINEVYPESTIDFRKGISCMTCHAAQDNIAAAARNLSVVGTNNFRYNNLYGIKYVNDRYEGNAPRLPTVSLPTLNKDPNFYRTEPSGKLFYRSYNGQLINSPLTNIASLGEAIAETEDFYICSAKKYYKILTGFDVSLIDSGDINYVPPTAEHLFHKNKVIQLGLKLKNEQRSIDIIRDIIESQDFVRPGVGQ